MASDNFNVDDFDIDSLFANYEQEQELKRQDYIKDIGKNPKKEIKSGLFSFYKNNVSYDNMLKILDIIRPQFIKAVDRNNSISLEVQVTTLYRLFGFDLDKIRSYRHDDFYLTYDYLIALIEGLYTAQQQGKKTVNLKLANISIEAEPDNVSNITYDIELSNLKINGQPIENYFRPSIPKPQPAQPQQQRPQPAPVQPKQQPVPAQPQPKQQPVPAQPVPAQPVPAQPKPPSFIVGIPKM